MSIDLGLNNNVASVVTQPTLYQSSQPALYQSSQPQLYQSTSYQQPIYQQPIYQQPQPMGGSFSLDSVYMSQAAQQQIYQNITLGTN